MLRREDGDVVWAVQFDGQTSNDHLDAELALDMAIEWLRATDPEKLPAKWATALRRARAKVGLMLNEDGFVEARTKPRASSRWAGSKTKGGPVTTRHKWDRSAALRALQEWARAHDGKAPRQHELRHANPPLPPNHFLQKEFGGVRQAVIAAGLPPDPRGKAQARAWATRKGTPRHEQDNGQPEIEPAVEPAVEEEAVVEPTSDLERLVGELKEAEATLAALRDPYREAKERVQLLRLELIDLLQDEKEL